MSMALSRRNCGVSHLEFEAGVAFLAGIVGLCVWLWRRNTPEALEQKLMQAEVRISQLRRKLAELQTIPKNVSRAEVRIWMDGAFDMMHYGHANAFRQGRLMGTHLVVGVNDDESIAYAKGPPLMSEIERHAMVESCKWVDEVVPRVPYVMSEEYLRWVIQRYHIDYVVHGDDPCIVDGRDVYESAQALGKYRTIPRTEGVSTTEIVGRMLLLSKDHHQVDGDGEAVVAGKALAPDQQQFGTWIRESKFMTTSRMLNLFSEGCSQPPADSRVVYVDGGWDMFHAGHVQFLRAARTFGDFLLVGVHNDTIVNHYRGSNFPIMNLNERVLSVLSCRFTGDVVINPPWHMTREMIAALKISAVVHGTTHDKNHDGGQDPYAVPKAMGIFHELNSEGTLTVDVIIDRIHANRERVDAKVAKKKLSEQDYYNLRYGLDALDASATTGCSGSAS